MISIIVPVRNEAGCIGGLLSSLCALTGSKEIIVVDGGSSDSTCDVVRQFPEVTLLESSPGRGLQLCQGVEAAKGDIFWFVHADAVVEPQSLEQIHGVLSRKECPGFGCFSLYFSDADSPGLGFIARTSNRRAQRLGLIFGDQGMFITRSVYEATGGFLPMPIMEDWEYSRRLVKRGLPFVLNTPIGTSGRRFIEGGVFRTLMSMHIRKLRFTLGTSPEKLSREYREVRS